jgi:ABC-type multidrug transport system permease subunit
MGWYAVFRRELLLLRKKVGRLGYVFSSIISPFIYLTAFGLGLGNRVVDVEGGYISFLAAGILAVTIMMNSFQQTASSVSTGKLYFHIFQSLILSPIRDVEVVFGIVLAGMARAFLFGSLIFLMAWGLFGISISPLTGLVGALLGAFCFASMGTVVGLLVRHPDDVSMVNNFFIMPMTFFGGSFFPIKNLPEILQVLASFFPIGSLNLLLRAAEWNDASFKAAAILLGIGIIFFLYAVYLYRNYSE